jgi:hypothetical protein
MKLTALISVILLTTIGLVTNLPADLPQTASNSRLRQAFGAQQWGRTIQAVNQMNGGTQSQPNSKLTLYKALLSHR